MDDEKRQELLKTEEPLSYVDDDIYWKMAGITIHGTDAGWFLTECAVRTILLIWENRVSVI